jgi:methionine--tRNA ligase beta chain
VDNPKPFLAFHDPLRIPLKLSFPSASYVYYHASRRDGSKAEVEMSTDKVSYDEFSKLDIRVGRIVEAKKVEGSRKLIELKIDLGGSVKRAVAGIAAYYDVEKLPGAQVAVVTNLQPRVLMGLESEVMILAAFANDKLSVLKPDVEIENGAKVS